jgi:hypothetical protein
MGEGKSECLLGRFPPYPLVDCPEYPNAGLASTAVSNEATLFFGLANKLRFVRSKSAPTRVRSTAWEQLIRPLFSGT